MPRIFGIDDWFKSLLIESCEKWLKDIFSDVNRISAEVGNELSKSPETFNRQIFEILQKISEFVVLPIGISLVSLLLVSNLCKSFLDERERENPAKIFIFFIIKSVVALLLVAHSFELVNIIINLTQGIVENALNLFSKENVSLSASLDIFVSNLENMSIGQILGTWTTLLITNIIIMFVRVFSQVVVLGRFIELYMRISISPVPFATFFHRELSNTGYNFIKSIGAVCLQAILIMVVIALYRALLSTIAVDIGTQEAVSLFLIKILVINLTLIFMLFNTKRVADSILQVH